MRDYWNAKDNAKLFPNESLCFIDGMGQNTTMVPKIRQSVKGIEGRYVKTHLCGVLVHGEGLYSDVWIDSHHKHDNNQVITFIMYAIADVKARRGGILPSTLRIQADNCGSENKNQYMFGMCAALVGLGYFAEIHLGFLLVGHTHEDIDQIFSVIFGTLKRQDVDSMQQLLDLVKEGTSPTETFRISRHLEYIWDWKKFITPYLFTCPCAFEGISKPHHFRFYLKNNKTFVKTKHYARDSNWKPANGYQCLNELPERGFKPEFAKAEEATKQDMKALEKFIK